MTTRKRSNSLIPIEFRNDTSDGGMERAALATVFGVPEYTESKIFWNADEDEDLSSLSSGFRPVQRNASKKSYTSTKSNTMMIQPKQQQETYVSHQRSLPTIPVVSEFGDIWSETNQKEQTKQDEAMIQPPADLSDYPLTIFDLVESDHDQSIILWGTQQQTTVPSNAPSSHEQKKPSHPHAHKLTWSTAQHLLSTSLKLKKKSMSTQQLPIQVSEVSQVIEAATIEKLIEKLTISLDYTFMTDFFLIFRVFMTPVQLCKLLILRFKWSLENTDEKRCVIRIRTFVVMRHWLLNYFLHDFVPSKELRTILTNFLNETPFHPTVKQSPRDQRIIKGLKRVVRRLKKIYYASSSSTRVQVIGPPPPTYEQERVNAMVKEKLAHNSIRQKTLDVVTGVHVDARHSNNTAVRDKHAAQVVVIGNYPSSSSTKTSHTFLDSSRHRRRGSSVSSSVSNNISVDSSAPTNMYNLDDSNNSATKEWNNIKQKGQWGNKSQDFDSSRLSDNSLESLISPGTSDISEYEDEDDEEDAASLSQASFQQNTNHVPTSELTEKLEKIRHEQDLNKQFPPKAFYNAQLAIPSTTSTPDVYYPTSHYFNSKPEVNTSFVRSNSDPTGSEIMHTNQQETNLQLLQQKPMRNKPVDPRTKPLPPLALSSSQESDIGESTLLSSSIISHAKTKQLPRGPSNETWKISAPRNQNQPPEKSSKEDLQSLKPSESNFSTATPKSRIMEIDIDHPQPHMYSTLPPFMPALQLNNHERRSIVLDYSTSLMAQQFCLIEKAILLDVNWEELVDCRWTQMPASSLYKPRNSAYEDSLYDLEDEYLQQGMYSRKKRMKQQYERNNNVPERGIEKAINRFNAVCLWVSSEIVQTRQLDQRVKLIEKFIRLAKKCKLYCNFSTLLQILLGLQSSSVSRLEKTWSLVSKREMKVLQELSTFTSPTKNWKHIRDSMSKVAEEYGESPTEIQVEVDGRKKKSSMTIKLPFGGCIPFLGIYLSDLVFNAELPSYLPSPNRYHQGRNKLESIVLSQPLVHFRKHRITATVIKRVLVFQNLAKRYSFDACNDEMLYNTCFQVVSLNMDTIQKQSHEIEP